MTQNAESQKNQAYQIIKSPLDNKEYASLKLPNGLQCLIISDATAKLSAVSLSVGSGATNETGKHEGIAHYLEHMLFLGSKKYPKADSFMEYVSQNGGSYNAYTASEETNFFFSIHPQTLPEALARFSDFFIAPLLTEEFMQREQQAVHAEYTSKLQNEARRNLDALRETFNKDNPISRFSAGNAQSLAIEPQLRTELIDFYQNNYFAENMNLVLLTPNSINATQDLIKEYFTDLPTMTKQGLTKKADLPQTPIFTEDFLPAQLQIKPLQEKYEMQLLFPTANPEKYYSQKPDVYLSDLIADEGQGSILQALKDLGWALELSAGTGLKYENQGLFIIHLVLTKDGYKHREEIKALIFAYIDLIKKSGINAWRFEQLAKLSELDWNYNEGENPLDLVMSLAADLRKYPIGDILKSSYIFSHYDEKLIGEFLHNLRIENCLEVLISPDVQTEQKSQWLDTPYKLSKNSTDLADIQAFSDKLHLPEANPYIAEQKLLGQTTCLPSKKFESENLEIWLGEDASFNTPKVYYKFKFNSKIALKSAKYAAMNALLRDWLNFILGAKTYPAYLANLKTGIELHKTGWSISIKGLSAKSADLLADVLQEIKNSHLDAEQFNILKANLIRKIANKKYSSLHTQVLNRFNDALIPPYFADGDLIDNLKKLSLADLEKYRREFLLSAKITAFLYGNADENAMLAIKNLLENFISLGSQTTQADLKTKQLESGKTQELNCKIKNPDTCLFYYVQGADDSLESRAKFALLTNLQSAEFFYQLRTLQQLGYIVMNTNRPLPEYSGMGYLVQSPTTEIEKITLAIREFLQQDLVRLEQMSQEEYRDFQQGLANSIDKPDDSLYACAARYWTNIIYKRQMQDYRKDLAQCVLDINLEQMQEFYKQILANKYGCLIVSNA